MDGKLTSEAIYAHYLNLSRADQNKDWKPFNNLLELLKKFDALTGNSLEAAAQVEKAGKEKTQEEKKKRFWKT